MASPIATTRSLPSTTSSRQAASVRPLRTSSPMASKSPWMARPLVSPGFTARPSLSVF